MAIRFCDDRGTAGFSWIVDEPATRTSHALVADGRVWLVDPVDWPPAIDRTLDFGAPAAVLQLLDRHDRDCASVAARLGVPHQVAPPVLADTPFEVVAIRRSRHWHEVALWWSQAQTLVVAEALGTNAFYTGGRDRVGVHLLLRLAPPRQLGSLAPTHLLVGHGEGLHGEEVTARVRTALARSRSGLLHVVPRIPALIVDARRRRR